MIWTINYWRFANKSKGSKHFTLITMLEIPKMWRCAGQIINSNTQKKSSEFCSSWFYRTDMTWILFNEYWSSSGARVIFTPTPTHTPGHFRSMEIKIPGVRYFRAYKMVSVFAWPEFSWFQSKGHLKSEAWYHLYYLQKNICYEKEKTNISGDLACVPQRLLLKANVSNN